jgi:glyoxylase-like metal-dependent hydrolase (beta-lactamase superfamily II)
MERGASGHRVGGLEVVPVLDGAGRFTLGSLEESFPGATSDDWDLARRVDRKAFAVDGSWHLVFRSFLVRDDSGACLLVDTGIGPSGSLASSWAPTPGRLPDSLTQAGVAAEDVDVVVLSHLHTDHIGWSVTEDQRPFFPHARYLVQQADVDAVAGSPIEETVLAPLRAADQLWVTEGGTRLMGRADESVTTVPTPGHTPGHQCVLVEARDEQVLLTGDLLVHAVQLGNPAVPYAHETDPELAATSRRDLLASLAPDALLGTPHLNQAFVPVSGAGRPPRS